MDSGGQPPNDLTGGSKPLTATLPTDLTVDPAHLTALIRNEDRPCYSCEAVAWFVIKNLVREEQ